MKQTLYSIQYLRFIAAAMVVVLHISHSLSHYMHSPTAGEFAMGVTGVDIFFVISGFIMFMITRSSSRTPLEFFLLRFTRIAPSYWVVTTLVLIMVLLRPQLFFAADPDVAHIIASYAFVPWAHPSDATHLQPLLRVGWTLNMEFLFYSLVTLTLLVPASADRRMMLCIALLVGLALVGTLVPFETAAFKVWTSTTMLEFALGIAIGWIYQANWRVPAALSLGLFVCGFALLWYLPVPLGAHDPMRWITAGLPSALILIGALQLEKAGKVAELPWLRFLGDVSFALYLCHYFAIGIMRALWPKAWVGGMINDLSFYAAAFVLSLVGSIVFYLLIERPTVAAAQVVVKRCFRRPAPQSS